MYILYMKLVEVTLINAADLGFSGISQRCFSKFIEVAPSEPTMIGVTFAFHILLFLYFNVIIFDTH